MAYKLDIFLVVPYKCMHLTVPDQASVKRCGCIILSLFLTDDFFSSGSMFSEINPKVPSDLRKKASLTVLVLCAGAEKVCGISISSPWPGHTGCMILPLLCAVL